MTWLRELLDARLIAVFATFDLSAGIHAVPMWFASDEQSILLAYRLDQPQGDEPKSRPARQAPYANRQLRAAGRALPLLTTEPRG